MALETSKSSKWQVATSIEYLSRELLNLASRGCTCYYFFIIYLGIRCKWHRSRVLSHFLSLVIFWWLSSLECIIDIKLRRLCFFLFLQLCIVASLCIFLFYLLLHFFFVWCRSLTRCIFVLFWSLLCEGVSLFCWLFDLIVHVPFYNIATIGWMFISKFYFDVFFFFFYYYYFQAMLMDLCF